MAEDATVEDKYANEVAPALLTDSDPTRFYLGGTVGGILPVVWTGPGTVGEGVALAVRAGVLFNGHVQLQAELSPLSTWMFNVTQESPSNPLGLLEATGTIGYLIPMNDFTSWILRVGGGGGMMLTKPPTGLVGYGALSSTTGFAEFRVDALGVAIRTSEHLLVECNLPSFRVLVPSAPPNSYSNRGVFLEWVSNIGIDYVF